MLSHPIFIFNQTEITNSRYLLTSLLLAACVRSKESLPSLWPRQIFLNLSCSFLPLLINIGNKKMKSRTHPVYLSHLATSLPSHLSHLATSSLLPLSPTFLNLPCHCTPTSPTLLPHYPLTLCTFPASCSPTFPTFAARYPPTFLSSAPSQRLKGHSKIMFFH